MLAMMRVVLSVALLAMPSQSIAQENRVAYQAEAAIASADVVRFWSPTAWPRTGDGGSVHVMVATRKSGELPNGAAVVSLSRTVNCKTGSIVSSYREFSQNGRRLQESDAIPAQVLSLVEQGLAERLEDLCKSENILPVSTSEKSDSLREMDVFGPEEALALLDRRIATIAVASALPRTGKFVVRRTNSAVYVLDFSRRDPDEVFSRVSWAFLSPTSPGAYVRIEYRADCSRLIAAREIFAVYGPDNQPFRAFGASPEAPFTDLTVEPFLRASCGWREPDVGEPIFESLSEALDRARG